MTDFRCFSLHFYFKILGANIDGEVEDAIYSKVSLDECVGGDKQSLDEILSLEGFKEMSESYRGICSKSLNVPLENVIQVTRDEYIANSEDE